MGETIVRYLLLSCLGGAVLCTRGAPAIPYAATEGRARPAPTAQVVEPEPVARPITALAIGPEEHPASLPGRATVPRVAVAMSAWPEVPKAASPPTTVRPDAIRLIDRETMLGLTVAPTALTEPRVLPAPQEPPGPAESPLPVEDPPAGVAWMSGHIEEVMSRIDGLVEESFELQLALLRLRLRGGSGQDAAHEGPPEPMPEEEER